MTSRKHNTNMVSNVLSYIDRGHTLKISNATMENETTSKKTQPRLAVGVNNICGDAFFRVQRSSPPWQKQETPEMKSLQQQSDAHRHGAFEHTYNIARVGRMVQVDLIENWYLRTQRPNYLCHTHTHIPGSSLAGACPQRRTFSPPPSTSSRAS